MLKQASLLRRSGFRPTKREQHVCTSAVISFRDKCCRLRHLTLFRAFRFADMHQCSIIMSRRSTNPHLREG